MSAWNAILQATHSALIDELNARFPEEKLELGLPKRFEGFPEANHVNLYDYNATVISVHDGDTCRLDVDLGFYTHRLMNIRWYGVNAPELSTPAGIEARDYLRGLLPAGATVVLTSIRDRADKYGDRWLGIITLDGVNLNDLMVSSGHAVVYLP